ncbi:D-2-hydroxyacid dehydrogenase [Acetobacter sp. TBRC 12305]|uniref:D-2-hydroxyacid dehydrogenase n=1 Tax=Acetobacter garciniae TaxID=2817435 RepID=A0A939HPE2_9PROT|nr:D-2-hydroxyacid dehydrogenase [Acetobacter garciniae]MBO1324811.1 D-2-hydroxyacid dehydrogenase [Acetobacter garciniae]MBX0344502.1 D-2-hydroxyacid dehydrogenase [Acetobacter garciniae]
MTFLWSGDQPRVCVAHAHYDLKGELERRPNPPPCVQVQTLDELEKVAADADVLVISMLWKDRILDWAPRLKLVQSVSAGVDHYGHDLFRARGVHLCSAQGVNANAVSDHALGLLLSLSRRLYEARDDQAKPYWRPTSSDPATRLQELSGKTVLVVGYGGIGARVAQLCKAFDMNVLAMRRTVSAASDGGIRMIGKDDLLATLPEVDVVILTCPLTPETFGLMGTEAFAALRPGAALINVARGKVVDQAAMIAALNSGRLGAAALDTFVEEPLPASSPLWGMENVVITPHAAGETQFYERNVIDILLHNIHALEHGGKLKNQIV